MNNSLVFDIDVNDFSGNEEENSTADELLSQHLPETDEEEKEKDEVTSEKSTEDDDFVKALDFVTDYSKLNRLNEEADNLYELVQNWIECADAIKANPTYLSLIQEPRNDDIIRYTVVSKKELNLGTLNLLLLFSSKNGISTVSFPITFSQTSGSSIFYAPPPDCRKLTDAYLILSFDVNKYSAAENVYNEYKTDESDEKMDYSPVFGNNDCEKMKFKDITTNASSNLKGDFEGEYLNLADIFNENDDYYFDSKDDSENLGRATDDSDEDSIEDEDELDDLKQIFAYKLKIHIN